MKGSRFTRLVLAVMVLGISCVQGARAPQVAPRGTLALGDAEGGPTGQDGPFAVVFGSPRGQTEGPVEISLVFNRPMRPLELAGGATEGAAETAAPARISPSVPGRWRWIGTSGLTFAPDAPLPRATRFTVTVPEGTRSLDGEPLVKPYVLELATARPGLVRAEPAEGSEDLEPGARFTLRFDQPIGDGEVKRAVRLVAGGKPVAFAVGRPDPQNRMLALLTPRTPLPLGTGVELEVDASLRGEEGPLEAGEAERLRYRTYGPLRVAQVECDRDTPQKRCSAAGGLRLELSNRVKLSDLKRALRVEPPVKIQWPSWYSDDELTSGVSIAGSFSPGKSYTVRIAAGLRDDHGQTLGAAWSHAHVVDDLWPVAEIGLAGSYFEPAARKDIPLGAVNVAALDLAVAALDEAAVLALSDAPASRARGLGFDDIARVSGAKVTQLRPTAPVNTAWSHAVRTEDALGGKDARGPVAIALGFTERPGTPGARRASKIGIAQVTDLSISAKVSPHGAVVWVTSLASGAPVGGASVWIRRPGATTADVFTTDANGLALIPANRFQLARSGAESAVVFARLGKDWSYRRVADAMGGWRFGIPVELGEDRPFGMVFSDRGIYRPGDVARLKGIVRQEAHPGTITPSGTEVEVKVEGPEGDAVSTTTQVLSAFGTFSVDVKVPETGRLGTYGIQAKVAGSPRDWADISADFEVAEYRAAEFTVSVESDRPSYVRGDKATWTARGDLLFGAPMSRAPARITVTRAVTGFTPPGVEGFVTGEEVYRRDLEETSPREYEVQSGRTQLDAKGAAQTAATLTMPGQRGPELVTCEAEVTDLSRQAIAGSSTALVHPGEIYVAMDPGPELFLAPGKRVEPRLLAVDPKGARVAQVKIDVDLVKRTWSVAKQQIGGAGHHSVTSPVDKVVASCSVVTGATPATCALLPPSAGYYLLHARATDRRGNKVAAASSLYVTGEGQTGWADTDASTVELTTDRKSYEIGQTARILVKSPFKTAEALVTVERAGVYTQRRIAVSGGMPTIDVPITANLRPNAFVSVLLVRGRTRAAPAKPKGPDVGAPAFRIGYAELPVNPEARRLQVALTPNKSDYRPGDPIAVEGVVRDKAGKPARAEVTLYAVDEGVLTLVGYKTPDPIPVFGAARALQVLTVESREAIARVGNPFAELGLDKGLEGGGGGDTSVRRDFRASAYYHPALVTDAEGKIKASFKLPDGLTTYRIMAVVAAEDDRFGYAESRVTTSRPLMARPAFPRVLRAGDRFEAGVVVTAKGIARARIDVDVVAEGLVAKETHRSVDLAAGDSVEVRFPFDAPSVGKARVKFAVKGGGAEDAVEITREVLVPQVLEAVALYGDTGDESAERLGDLGAIRRDVGGLEVSLSSSALVGLDNGVEQLLEYPYGCTEQLVSRLVPMLPLRDLAKDYGIALPPDLDKQVNKTVAEIVSHQRGDGGFGLWAESPETSTWVTAYALWGLSEAKRRGAPVPAASLESATRFVRGSLEREQDDTISLASAAFIVDVLAQNGAPDPGRVSRLLEQKKELPLFARALLLHAMVLSKSDPRAVTELAAELEGQLRIDGPHARAVVNHGDRYAVLMDSEARTSALVLRALVAARPSHPMASRLAMGLVAARSGGAWRSTQETAWALLSLDDYRRAQEKTVPDFDARVFLGESLLFEAPFRGRSLAEPSTTIPAARVAGAGGAPLAFAVDGDGRLFYEARLRYARAELPRKPIERGFFVKKTLRAVTPEGLESALGVMPERSVEQLTAGDLVLVDLVVVTPSPREFVVIDDPLAAGLEAIDARLATSAGSLDVDRAQDRSGGGGEPDDDETARGGAYRPSWFLREIRDDRVLFFVDHMAAGMYRYRYLARATTHGRFVVPPTKAEEMYTPETFGRTGATVLTVAARP